MGEEEAGRATCESRWKAGGRKQLVRQRGELGAQRPTRLIEGTLLDVGTLQGADELD